jgi:hypothetical protein
MFPEDELPSHKRGSSKIDFCFASQRTLQCVVRSGILTFDTLFTSDHRPLFVDVDIQQLFEGETSEPVRQDARVINTRNKKRMATFLQTVQMEWLRRKMSDRINALVNTSLIPEQNRSDGKVAQTWEKLDVEIGKIIESAEKELYIPTKKHDWSPSIQKAVIAKRYWKARWTNAIHDKAQGLRCAQ